MLLYSDNIDAKMGVAVCENIKGSKEDAILIPETEKDNEFDSKTKIYFGVSLIMFGVLIAIITVSNFCN